MIEYYEALPATTRQQIDARVEQLLEWPEGPREAYDARRDRCPRDGPLSQADTIALAENILRRAGVPMPVPRSDLVALLNTASTHLRDHVLPRTYSLTVGPWGDLAIGAAGQPRPAPASWRN